MESAVRQALINGYNVTVLNERAEALRAHPKGERVTAQKGFHYSPVRDSLNNGVNLKPAIAIVS